MNLNICKRDLHNVLNIIVKIIKIFEWYTSFDKKENENFFRIKMSKKIEKLKVFFSINQD